MQPPSLEDLNADQNAVLVDGLRLQRHPNFDQLRRLLVVELPADLHQLFQGTAAAQNARGSGTPFDDVRAVRGDDAARRMYELLNGGVQEGARSAFYHLGRLESLAHEVRRLGTEMMASIKPTRSMSMGLASNALTSEYEAFTLMSRATLDRLCWFFRAYFRTNAGNLYKLKSELGNNRKDDSRALHLIAAIERHLDYLDTQISTDKAARSTTRDRIAHREYVSFTTMNIIGMADGSVQAVGVTPDGRIADDPVRALTDQFDALKATVIDLVASFLGWR